jgi:xanthine/uracil/vitamin C permease (AzgA family)
LVIGALPVIGFACFHLRDARIIVRREIVAGVTTFLTMAYIVAV